MSAPETSPLSRALETLTSAQPGSTIVAATMNAETMALHTFAPRGPKDIVHIARRLLEEARDQYAEAAAGDAPSEDDGFMEECLSAALGEFPPEDDEAAP
jgi:hypothetical protein